MRIGLYAGSFDPITRGHEDLIRRSLSFVDRLIVAVATNSTKQPLFTVEELRGADVGVWRSELPELEAGEYYWEDLLDLEAFTPQGERLGKIDHFSETPAHPLLIVKGEREHWIPLVKGRIKSVDVAQRRVVVDWGLDW